MVGGFGYNILYRILVNILWEISGNIVKVCRGLHLLLNRNYLLKYLLDIKRENKEFKDALSKI